MASEQEESQTSNIDDMHCRVCNTDVFNPKIASYAMVHWNPDTQSNELIAVFCTEHMPIPRG